MPSLAQCFPVPRRSRPRLHLQPGQLVRLIYFLCWRRPCSVLQVLAVLVLTTSGRESEVRREVVAQSLSSAFWGSGRDGAKRACWRAWCACLLRGTYD